MTTTETPQESRVHERMERIEELVHQVERSSDPATRDAAGRMVRALLDLHADGFERLLGLMSDAGEPGRAVLEKITEDELLAHLLLLHGLHPRSVETRVREALDGVRPYLRSHGGNVELLDASEQRVRLRMAGSCHGCPSSSQTLKYAIEDAIYKAAPEIGGIEVEGAAPPPAAKPDVVELGLPGGGAADARQNGHGRAGGLAPSEADANEDAPANGRGAWRAVDGLTALTDGSTRPLQVGDQPILFCRASETFYAYRDRCPDCERALHGGRFENATLTCPACGRRYDARRAGRAIDRSDLHLTPLPLLVERGRVKIALAP